MCDHFFSKSFKDDEEQLPQAILPGRETTSDISESESVVAFEIEPNINITSKALLDMISEKAMIPEMDEMVVTKPGPELNRVDEESVEDAFADF